MEGPHLHYDVAVRWAGGKSAAAGGAGLPDIQVALPSDLSNAAEAWTPEQLFVAAAASCLLTVFLNLAAAARLDFTGLTVQAHGILEELATEGPIISTLELKPVLILEREADRERAARLLSKAERHCVVSNSMRTRILVRPSIRVRSASDSLRAAAGD
jgi:organic hydroperoxide reductase OsmC/OhrA